ncbi:hypothetical protein VCRA2127O344_20770 [Vibrio crassostreae]|nr:hypothetical protein VCRA2127O344_20770 [Vibrio crassostreae]
MDRLGAALIGYFLSREANYTEKHQVRNNVLAIVDIGGSYRSPPSKTSIRSHSSRSLIPHQ